MALALLELVALERGSARFSIDTGTNLFCRLKFGRSVQRKSGIDWVDDLLFTTPMARSPSGGQLLSSEKDVSVPLKQFGGGNVYVQLFSFKNAEGRSPGFSTPILLPMGAGTAGRTLLLGESAMMMSVDPFRTARTVPCRTYSDTYSKQASLEDLLSGILKAAAPAVLNLLGSQNGSQPASGGAATAGGDSGPAGILALLLKAVLGSLQGGTVKGMSGSQSLLTANGSDGNRFLDGQNASYSRPFIFGIDDALIGALAGPILQMLPQLMNAANQKRVQMKQADNKLITDILSDTNRRLLLEQLLQAQQKPAV